MNKPLLAAICLGATLGGSMLSMAAQAEIYKWKDANGVIRYSDIPPPANVQTESLKSGRAPAPVAKPAATKAKALGAGEGGDTAAVKPEDVTPEKVKEAEDILKKLSLVGKDLDEYSLETVKMFHDDAGAAGFSLELAARR